MASSCPQIHRALEYDVLEQGLKEVMNSNEAVGVGVICHMANDLTRRGNLNTDTSNICTERTVMKDTGMRHHLQDV